MAGKFMKVRKVVIPALTLIALLAQSTPALAMTPAEATDFLGEGQTIVMELAEVDAITSAAPIYTADGQKVVYASNNIAEVTTVDKSIQATSFTDLAGYEWARAAIEDMASRGIIKGVGDNKFAPAENVTRIQFASMAIRAFGGEDTVTKLATQASQKAATDSNYTSLDELNKLYKTTSGTPQWYNSVICSIQMFPELDSKWQCSEIYWNEDATRADMALIVMSIAEQLGNEKFEIKENIQNNIGDYSAVASNPSGDYILKAYSNGLLVGTNSNGDYSPSANAKRAEAAVIMQRVVDPSKRTEVVVKEAEKPIVPPVQEGENVFDGTVYPVEGDVINGKVVTRDPETGILGLDVKGGIYLGVEVLHTDGTKHPIKVGTYASDSYDNMGGQYAELHGYTLWGKEFTILNGYARSRLPVASAAYEGKYADIKGNITTNVSEAFYRCDKNQVFGDYEWTYLD